MQIDWDVVGGIAFIAVTAGVPVCIPIVILIVMLYRRQQMRSQVPGPLTIAEVRQRLGASGLSFADKRELKRRFDGQRVRWACTFQDLSVIGTSVSALCIGEPYGQFFFDPARADRKRLEQTPGGTRLVVEGTVRINLQHDLLTLEAPIVRFDLQPQFGGALPGQPGQRAWG